MKYPVLHPSRVALTFVLGAVIGCLIDDSARADAAKKVLKAGAYAMDVTPLKLPVIVNGGMAERLGTKINDRLHARCLVLDDGTGRIALVVVDSCMIPRELLDEAKRLAHAATGISPDKMLISATHSHSAPAAMGCLGSDRDDAYAAFLPGQIAKGIARANKQLVPARIGWAVGKEPTNIYCRRFVMKPGTARTNPFGGTKDDQAQMNPGFENPNSVKRTGVVDDDVSIVSIVSRDGKPLALLGNYSTHYVGSPAISADYFAVFADKMAARLAAGDSKPAFVGILSNGTSGDANCNDFTRPRRRYDRFTVAEDVAKVAHQAYRTIKYYDWVPIVMHERKLTLNVRLPDEEELSRAKEVVASLAGRKPKTIPEVYAREAVLLADGPPTRELKLQAIRLGSLGITAIPNEVYGSTGLKLKKQSPLETTVNIELANGAEGYIPPPEQHKLGGYTAWRARTSCLEVEAEPKIVKTLLSALEHVAGERKDEQPVPSP